MAELLKGYKDVPEEHRKRAEVLFQKAAAVARSNPEYGIELYLQTLTLDPESIEAHQALRDLSLQRKLAGGKSLGMMERMKLGRRGKDEKANMLNFEKLMAYEPGNVDYMMGVLESAFAEGCYDTVLWIGPILRKGIADSKSPSFDKLMKLKNTYKELQQWKEAVDVAQDAAILKPYDMDLGNEIKDLSVYHTMEKGKYNGAGSFRKSLKDAGAQQKLMDNEKDIRTEESLLRSVREAELEFQANTQDPGKFMRYIEALARTESESLEAQAMELLQQWYESTKQFRFRHAAGRIRLDQLKRKDRILKAQYQANPSDATAKQEYIEFMRQRLQEELTEYTLWAANYPTDNAHKFNMAVRMFQLGQFDEAIPVFQHARQDPKFRADASIFLGRAFLEAKYVEEAIDTLKACIDDYRVPGDDKSKDMTYYYGRALETKGERDTALKAYSQVAVWDFNYRDVQTRIKNLRGGGATQS